MSLNHTKLLWIVHLDSFGSLLVRIDHRIKNVLELRLHYNYSTVPYDVQ